MLSGSKTCIDNLTLCLQYTVMTEEVNDNRTQVVSRQATRRA